MNLHRFRRYPFRRQLRNYIFSISISFILGTDCSIYSPSLGMGQKYTWAETVSTAANKAVAMAAIEVNFIANNTTNLRNVRLLYKWARQRFLWNTALKFKFGSGSSSNVFIVPEPSIFWVWNFTVFGSKYNWRQSNQLFIAFNETICKVLIRYLFSCIHCAKLNVN